MLLVNLSFGQELSGEELLDKAIQYHDPYNNWEKFKGTFTVTMKTPKKPDRVTEIKINLPEESFYSKATRDTLITEFAIHKDSCSIKLNGEENISDELAKTHRLSCERATMYKNYYTYLYGLPMKLKDPGTIIHESTQNKTFKGKEYLVLKVTYTETVGGDTWYFYFDPKTYAMKVYQFYHKEEENDGEYILLEEEEFVNEIKMPKIRHWYTNKEDKLLGTDILN